MPKPEQKKENLPLRMDLNRGIDLVRGAVRLGRAVEQMTDDTPNDASAPSPHVDRKRRRKLQQKKTALGHAEDDPEDWDMKQEL